MSLWITIVLVLAAVAAVAAGIALGRGRRSGTTIEAGPPPHHERVDLPPSRSATLGEEASGPEPEPGKPSKPEPPGDVDPCPSYGRGEGSRPLSVEVREPDQGGGSKSGVSPLGASFAARFYAFHPQEVAAGAWFRLHAYAARAGAEDEVRADLERVTERPEELRQIGRVASRPIAEGALIAVTPRAEGVEFNPPRLELAFLRDLHRFDFDGRAESARAGGLAAGEIVFSVAGVVVGAMPLAIYVALADPAAEAPPLRFERVEQSAYRKIFPSYSHRDTHVVRRIERAYQALGDEVLRDALALKSGERWDHRLLALIEEADLFQLFWSPSAAESRYVADEWGHALGLIDERRKGERFIRPVYWRKPFPAPPPPLEERRIHFHFDPELDDRAAAEEAP